MSMKLGLDTGGTYTDAVLFDDDQGVIGTAKALTTKHDLSIGITKAIEAVMPPSQPEIQLVSLSTTLATNAIVEGQGRPVCLVLIGYDPDLLGDLEFEKIMAREKIVFINGGHNGMGMEMASLDIEAARRAILAQAPHVEAFAVSGYFGVRNPTHELQVRQLIRELTGKPVTCGHELTTNLNAPRRALTVTLNARLMPLLEELILTVRNTLIRQNIHAPLMVVKGDGSLVDAEMAIERPVETILSGPAASVVGASYYADVDDAFVIDMGGTTTDIAAMRNGRPSLNPDGARVGDLQVMVEAIDTHTTGLGGDSEILLDENGGLHAGPSRVIPLCLLAEQHPTVLSALEHQVDSYKNIEKDSTDGGQGHFILRQRQLEKGQGNLTSIQKEIWEALDAGPVPISQLLDTVKYPFLYRNSLSQLIEQGLVVASSFTPTDAVHVLGQYQLWSVKAAKLGAILWANQLGISVDNFCKQVVRQVEVQIGRAVIGSALAEEKELRITRQDSIGRLLIDRALGAHKGGLFSVSLDMQHLLVAIGAPVISYLPSVAEQLHASLLIPDHADVNNALGAVVGGVVQNVRVLIQPLDMGNAYQVHLPSEVRDFPQLEDAVAYAREVAQKTAQDLARRAGASEVKVDIKRKDHIVRDAREWAEEIYLGTDIIATAVGRPRIGV